MHTYYVYYYYEMCARALFGDVCAEFESVWYIMKEKGEKKIELYSRSIIHNSARFEITNVI